MPPALDADDDTAMQEKPKEQIPEEEDKEYQYEDFDICFNPEEPVLGDQLPATPVPKAKSAPKTAPWQAPDQSVKEEPPESTVAAR